MSAVKKRILHFIESEGVYGAESVILNLSQQMRQTDNYTPIVGCIVAHPDSDSALFEAARELGIEAVKVPISNSRLFKDIPSAATQLKKLKIDLIHSHGYKPSVFGFIIHLLKKIPIIATCHLWFEPSKGPLKMRAMIWLEKLFYRWFPKVIAVSEPIKATLLASNLKQHQVELVRNGVKVAEHFPAPEQIHTLRHSLKLQPTDFCVLNSARLTRQKAQWTLVKAAALLKKQGHTIQFLIVGEGELASELRTQITNEQVGDCVHLLGFRRDINQLLAAADVFALPSIDEGMPMSLLEAAAANKPIISTLVGDIGKLIINEQTGLVIPTEDPAALAATIVRLKDNPALAQQLAQHAHRTMINEYSSQAMSSRYLIIYNELLQPTLP